MQVPERPRRWLLLLSVAAVTVSLAGCGMVAEDTASLPDGDAVSGQLDSLSTIEATVVANVTNESSTPSIRIQAVQHLRTGKARATILSGPREGVTAVSNGSVQWTYNRSTDRVEVVRTAGTRSNRTESFRTVETVFERLAGAERGESTEVSISQLPVVPHQGQPAPVASGSVSTFGNATLTYDGTATVADRETYVVHIEPIDEEQILGNATVWFDTEWYYPVKQHVTYRLENDTQHATVTYRNLTFNPAITDGTFTFEPPENATVVTGPTRRTRTYDTRATLVTATAAPVPDPELPERFRFARGRFATVGGNESVQLEYTTGTTNVTVVTTTGTIADAATGERVNVSGRDGRLLNYGKHEYVIWHCEEWTHAVKGPIEEEQLLSIARSIDCG